MRDDSELDNPQDSEIEEVCVNENKCPLIVEVSPISGLSMKFISVCQLRLKSGKYQVSHQNLTKIMRLFAPVLMAMERWNRGEEGESEIELCL